MTTNCDDVIDSRAIIARIEEMENEREDLESEILECEAAVVEAEDEFRGEEGPARRAAESLENARAALKYWDADYADELRALRALAEEVEPYCADWRDGATLIRDSYFEEYAMELAEEICDTPSTASWPLTHINWEAATAALKMDYTEVDFDGVSYWVRR
jgi:chromosome segregation ATPase